MNSGFYPQVLNSHLSVQNLSNALQTPFYFGGSNVPESLDLNKGPVGQGMVNNDNNIKYQNKGQIITKPYNVRYYMK